MDNLQKLFFFILALVLIIYLQKYGEKSAELNLNKPILSLIIIFPLTFLTSFLNGSSELLISQLTLLLPAISIVIFTTFLIVKLSEQSFFKITSLSVVNISTIFSLIGIFQVINIKTIPLPEILIPGSTIGQRGFASEYLIAAIPFFLIAKNFIKKENLLFLFLAGIVNLTFLFFTRSRSAFFISILLLGLIIVFVYAKKGHEEKLKTVMYLAASFAVSFLIFQIVPIKGERSDFKENISSTISTENKSNKLRLEFWQGSADMIKSNPLTGVGSGKWSGYFPRYFGEDFKDDQLNFVYGVHAHNDFLELSAENGIFSSLVYLLLILSVMISLIKKIKLNENYLFVFLSALSTIIVSFISFPMHKFSSYFLFSIAAGMSLISSGNKQNVLKINYEKSRKILFGFVVLGIITSFIRLSSDLSYIKSIEFKNGGDYKNMLTELNRINLILYPIDPTKQPIDYHLAYAYYRQGDLHSALKHSQRSEKIAPFNPYVLHLTAGIFQSLKQYPNAVTYYQKIKKLFPNYIDPQINLLIIYAETKENEKALKLYNDLISKAPNNSRLTSLKSRYQFLF